MAFGFVSERFGLFLAIPGREETKVFQRHISFLVGTTFIVMAAFLAGYSVIQHRRILVSLKPIEIPNGYNIVMGMITNVVVGALGADVAHSPRAGISVARWKTGMPPD